jgi:hypothetical protein
MTDKMPKWKLNIFINAITYRIKTEDRSAKDIITEYILLTEDEKAEILNNIGGETVGNI